MHVPTRRWTTFVGFRQRNASPGRTIYLNYLLFVSLGATKDKHQVSVHPTLNAPLRLRWLKRLQINISAKFPRVLTVFCPAPAPESGKNSGVHRFHRLSVSPRAPQSAQTSFPGICWIFRRDLAALSLSDISVRFFASLAESEMFGWPHRAAARVKACSTWLCSAGKSAQVPALSPGGGGTQTRVLSLAVHVMVGSGARQQSQAAGEAQNSAEGSEKLGLSKLSFPHFSPLCVFTRVLQPRTLTATHSVPHSCSICRGLLGWTGLKRCIMGPQQLKDGFASVRQTTFSDGEHLTSL